MTGRWLGILTFTCPLTPRTPLCQGGHKTSLSLAGAESFVLPHLHHELVDGRIPGEWDEAVRIDPTKMRHILLILNSNQTLMYGGQIQVIRRVLGKPILF